MNEAFFVKRERGPDAPLVRAEWALRRAEPVAAPALLVRDTVLAYAQAVDALGHGCWQVHAGIYYEVNFAKAPPKNGTSDQDGVAGFPCSFGL